MVSVMFSPEDTVIYIDTLYIDNNDELMEVVLTGVGLPSGSIDSEPLPELPTTYELGAIYPNPFNTQATIRYDVPVHGTVRIDIYDVLGRKITTLADGEMDAGRYGTVWDAGDMPSGIYFIRMEAGEFKEVQKMVLLK